MLARSPPARRSADPLCDGSTGRRWRSASSRDSLRSASSSSSSSELSAGDLLEVVQQFSAIQRIERARRDAQVVAVPPPAYHNVGSTAPPVSRGHDGHLGTAPTGAWEEPYVRSQRVAQARADALRIARLGLAGGVVHTAANDGPRKRAAPPPEHTTLRSAPIVAASLRQRATSGSSAGARPASSLSSVCSSEGRSRGPPSGEIGRSTSPSAVQPPPLREPATGFDASRSDSGVGLCGGAPEEREERRRRRFERALREGTRELTFTPRVSAHVPARIASVPLSGRGEWQDRLYTEYLCEEMQRRREAAAKFVARGAREELDAFVSECTFAPRTSEIHARDAHLMRPGSAPVPHHAGAGAARACERLYRLASGASPPLSNHEALRIIAEQQQEKEAAARAKQQQQRDGGHTPRPNATQLKLFRDAAKRTRRLDALAEEHHQRVCGGGTAKPRAAAPPEVFDAQYRHAQRREELAAEREQEALAALRAAAIPKITPHRSQQNLLQRHQSVFERLTTPRAEAGGGDGGSGEGGPASGESPSPSAEARARSGSGSGSGSGRSTLLATPEKEWQQHQRPTATSDRPGGSPAAPVGSSTPEAAATPPRDDRNSPRRRGTVISLVNFDEALQRSARRVPPPSPPSPSCGRGPM